MAFSVSCTWTSSLALFTNTAILSGTKLHYPLCVSIFFTWEEIATWWQFTSTLQLCIQMPNPIWIIFQLCFPSALPLLLRNTGASMLRLLTLVWFRGDVCPSCLFPLIPQHLGCHYFFLPPSSLPTKRGYWDGFGFYVIFGCFLKKPCELVFTGTNGVTIAGGGGSHVRTGAEGWGRLQAHAQNSFLRPSLLKLAQGTNEEP